MKFNHKAKLRRVLAAMDLDRIQDKGNVCDGCGKPEITHSHTISVKRCKEINKPELILDQDNIEYLCFDCHRAWEGYYGKSGRENINKITLNRMKEYVRQHDPQRYDFLQSN